MQPISCTAATLQRISESSNTVTVFNGYRVTTVNRDNYDNASQGNRTTVTTLANCFKTLGIVFCLK